MMHKVPIHMVHIHMVQIETVGHGQDSLSTRSSPRGTDDACSSHATPIKGKGEGTRHKKGPTRHKKGPTGHKKGPTGHKKGVGGTLDRLKGEGHEKGRESRKYRNDG